MLEGEEESVVEVPAPPPRRDWVSTMRSMKLALVLPGVLAGLTNTDVAAVVTFTQSGSTFALASLKFQLLCIPVMFTFQEFGARLGTKGRGLLVMTRDELGPTTTNFVFSILLVLCAATLFCEAAGVAAIAELWQAPKAFAVFVYSVVLLYTLTFRSTVAEYLCLGLAALLTFFVVLAGMAARERSPGWNLSSLNLANSEYDVLVVSATIGSALTPFLLFYQCAAAVDGRVSKRDLGPLRINIMIGILLSVACSVGITLSAAFEFWNVDDAPSIRTIQDCGDAFSRALGASGTIIFSLGLVGAAMTSSFTTLSTIKLAWAEVCGPPQKAEKQQQQQPALLAQTPEEENPLLRTEPVAAAKATALPSTTTMTKRFFPRVDPAMRLCVAALAVCDLTVLATTKNQQIKLEVQAQNLDCVLIPPALYLAIKIARRTLDKDEYPESERRAHVIGSILLSICALLPLLLAILIKVGVA
ncbi:hypothetical protein CTAYLR_004656 [Chrysophaeum taylorii]|uniref:Uncharacterized protein n=1 Tax=Chrysophaeum taylorii TaxID=2483200 RepID=A0AAD7U7I9_9STRA|nr:hypothetical protein CTAYLR_004656 [Chrysophaeum taylorii]